MRRSHRSLWLAAASAVIVVLGTYALVAQTQGDPLLKGFRNPPDSAKPRVWWHWMSGNVTKEGIKADLEWMKRVGIAGMQMFDGNLDTPIFVDKRLVWMTPDWKDAFRHAGDEAFLLTVFPKVPLAYVLWREDDEFPARVTVLFDVTIQTHFSLDGIWCLVSEVSRRLVDAKER